jgi:cytochrome b
MQNNPSTIRVRVWDLPTRVFHWATALCVLGLLATGTVGGSAMTFHFRFGFALLSLLLFRILWGVVGGHWSRFSSFIYGPRALLAYLRGQQPASHTVGHSPLGALSVWAMLGFLMLQVGTGLVSDDEIATSGPLAHLVSNAMVSLASSYHTRIGKLAVLALVLLHVGAIAVYTRRQKGLAAAMVHGDKPLAVPAPAARDDAVTRTAAAVLMALCIAAVYWVAGLAPAAL